MYNAGERQRSTTMKRMPKIIAVADGTLDSKILATERVRLGMGAPM